MVERYVKNVDLFVDDSQIVELECMRSGPWGEKSSGGWIASYRSE